MTDNHYTDDLLNCLYTNDLSELEIEERNKVFLRLINIFVPRVALDWLTSSNSYLDGARPIDVLKLRGSAEVIDALSVY